MNKVTNYTNTSAPQNKTRTFHSLECGPYYNHTDRLPLRHLLEGEYGAHARVSRTKTFVRRRFPSQSSQHKRGKCNIRKHNSVHGTCKCTHLLQTPLTVAPLGGNCGVTLTNVAPFILKAMWYNDFRIFPYCEDHRELTDCCSEECHLYVTRWTANQAGCSFS